jgi:surface protein
LSGSETVVSFAGSTTTPTISAGRVDWDSGTTLASLVLSDGTNYPCQEGPGLADANRTVYDVSGDSNHATLVNGTVANIWATRLTGTVKDHCIEYGGDIAANGAFIPALLDSSLAADGTAITLAAGHAMNPYSRINLNPFTAAELNGRSVPTSIGPRTDVSLLVTPSDSAFNRSSATQEDRIVISTEALTGDTLTSMQEYAPFTLTPNAYAIKIKTDNAGTSSSTQFTFPATGTYTISWGDGTVQTLTGAQTHTYPAAGTYVVQVTGGLTSVTYGGDKLKLLEIMQWGSIAWTTMANAYFGCSNMRGTFTDAPNLSAVTLMNSMFQSATAFNQAIDSWDVSAVTNMSFMFFGATAFNQAIDSWDVSAVTNMSGMLHSAASFNQPLDSWDVSSVTNMVSFMANKTATNYSASHLDAIYNQWSLLTLQPSLSISFGTIKYTAAGSAGRAVLTGAPNSWTIVDGGI